MYSIPIILHNFEIPYGSMNFVIAFYFVTFLALTIKRKLLIFLFLTYSYEKEYCKCHISLTSKSLYILIFPNKF